MQNNAACIFTTEKRIHLKEIDSTNNEARRLLNEHSVAKLDRTVVTAEYQTGGRGRIEGRRFFSPAGTGLYMSLILQPSDSFISTDLITPAAGVAVCRTIEKLTGRKAGIKWVNDIFLDGKKVCGILTEGVLSAEGKIEALILGIGVNIYEPEGGFPEELQSIVTSVAGRSDKKVINNKLSVDSFLEELLFQLSITLDASVTDETIQLYQDRSIVVGKRVTVFAGNDSYQADVLEVTKKCHLIVRPVDGNNGVASSETRELLSGEVSIKS